MRLTLADGGDFVSFLIRDFNRKFLLILIAVRFISQLSFLMAGSRFEVRGCVFILIAEYGMGFISVPLRLPLPLLRRPENRAQDQM